MYYLYNIFNQTLTNFFYLILICVFIRYIFYKEEKSKYKKMENDIENNKRENNERENIINNIEKNNGKRKKENLYDDIIDPNDLEYEN